MKGIRRNQVVITVLAILIAVAGYINYTGNLSDVISVSRLSDTDTYSDTLSTQTTENASMDEQSAQVNMSIAASNMSELSDEYINDDYPGSVILTSGEISALKLTREQVRAKSKEALMAVIDNKELTEEAKSGAIEKLNSLTEAADKEVSCELLLESKGFRDSVVSIVDDRCDVCINATSITEANRAQIEDIIKRKTGLKADKITINICNN